MCSRASQSHDDPMIDIEIDAMSSYGWINTNERFADQIIQVE